MTGDYSWTCQPVDYSNSPEGLRALNLAWIFYISKFIDMFDSLFFVLKKKFSHLSFLHVFHHGIMPLECWWGPRLLFYPCFMRETSFINTSGLLVVVMVDLEHFSMQEYIV